MRRNAGVFFSRGVGKASLRCISMLSLLLLSACSTLLFREKQQYIRYYVQSGDTLHGIGQRFSTASTAIADANDVSDPRALQVGQVLHIPYHGQSLSRGPGDVVRASYKVPAKSNGDIGSARKAGLANVSLGPAAKYVGRLQMPVTDKGTSINSSFGRRWTSFHEGIDIRGPEGTPVYAAADGVVVYSGDGIRGYGNIILVKSDGLLTVYGHNKRNRVKKGEQVRKGSRIADLGQSGKASGPHLHFETRIKDVDGRFQAVDPMAFF